VDSRLRGNDNGRDGNDNGRDSNDNWCDRNENMTGAKNATANSAITAMKKERDQTEGRPRIDALNGPMLPGRPWIW